MNYFLFQTHLANINQQNIWTGLSTTTLSLVRRVEILLGFDIINNWDTELKEMNQGKIGEPFHYPNTFLLLLGYAKAYFHLPYRQTKEGISQGHAKGKVSYLRFYNYLQKKE